MKKTYFLFIGIVVFVGAAFFIYLSGKVTNENQNQNNSSETEAEVKGASTQEDREQIIQSVSATEAEQIIEGNAYGGNNSFFILDIRTPEEFNQGNIEGAYNVDFYNGFEQELESMDKNANYLIYCQSGNRSSQALETFRSQGFYEVYELEGGYNNWQL